MADAAPANDTGATRLAYRLAAVVARPLDAIDPERGALEPLSAATTRALAANPHFRGPVNRAVAAQLGLFDIALDADDLRALAAAERAKMAAAFATDDLARVRDAARELGAAIVHKRALAFTLKSERDRVKAAFGEEPYRIATREAPMLYTSLADLDPGDVDVTAVARGAEEAELFARRLSGLGFQALSAFVQKSAPALSSLFGLRCPAQPEAQGGDHLLRRLEGPHCDHIVKLNRRRFEPWLATIG